MKLTQRSFLKIYALTLDLYPEPFRAKYEAQMMDAARCMQAESTDDLSLLVSFACDAFRAAISEHWHCATAVTTGSSVGFSIFFSALLMALSTGYQQISRHAADRQPSYLVATVQHQTARGEDVIPLTSAPTKEIASSTWLGGTSTFVALYDKDGRPIASDATLHGALPRLPVKIFADLRRHGERKVTWQPERGIRLAVVAHTLPDGRVVLAGQSLLGSETREIQLRTLLLWIWAAMFCATFNVVAASRAYTLHRL